MKQEILNNLDNPKELEKLFRNNNASFKLAFDELWPEIKDNKTAEIWNERLNFQETKIAGETNRELVFVVVASFIAGLVAKLPAFTNWNAEYFYQRNIGFIVLPLLIFFFAWKQKIEPKKILFLAITLFTSLLYINLLPDNRKSDTLILACIHLPLFLWSLLGFAFVGNDVNNHQRRIDFLKYNGNLVVMTTIILIAGMLMTGITIGLFSLINMNIGEFYFENIVVWGLAAAPIVGTYLVQTNPQLVNKVSPVIAKLFTPLVLVTLVIYLVATMVAGKDPFHDRNFLIVFNLLLIGVMAIIFFAIAETSDSGKSNFVNVLLFLLSVVTIIVNCIALSAIIFRIFEWGITPNRLAVLGGNILILVNLMLVAFQLFKGLQDEKQLRLVGQSISVFLPIYSLWTVFVTFLLPVLFGFV